jgi:hypothetical protein
MSDSRRLDGPRPRATTPLPPESVYLVETYLDRVHGAMLLAAAGESEEIVAELREHVYEQLERGDGTSASVTRILAELGPPEALARAYADEPESAVSAPSVVRADFAGRDSAPDETACEDLEGIHSPLAGRVLGVPFDFRRPTARRIAHRWWNLLDRRWLVPRTWGIGWDVNFGAIAVSLGVVRPDDEDVPFGAVPEVALLGAFAVPATLLVALIAMVALTYGRLPATVPMGWSLTGRPNQYWDTGVAAAFVLAMALAPVGVAGYLNLFRRSNLSRAVSAAAASLLATASLSTWTMAAFGGGRGLGTWPLGLGLLLALVLPFAVLATLSRIGRGAEMRRDLARQKKKECV